MRKSAPVPQQEALTVKQAWLAGTTGCRPEPGTIGHSHTCHSLRFTAVFESIYAGYGPIRPRLEFNFLTVLGPGTPASRHRLVCPLASSRS